MNLFDTKFKEHNDNGDISSDVMTNSSIIINSFDNVKDISIENITCTEYGTVIIEIDKPKGSIFLLEIGKTGIGYFAEIENRTLLFTENLKMNTENLNATLTKLNNDIKIFLNETNGD